MTTDTDGSTRYETNAPECPHCGHVFDHDDMLAGSTDLFALAPNEERCTVECPACDREFWLKGSYLPRYTSAMAEELL